MGALISISNGVVSLSLPQKPHQGAAQSSPATMGRTCPSAGLWPVRTSCVFARCAHVAPSMYVAALRTFARPCCVLGVLVQLCRRTYLDGESACTTPPTAPALLPGVLTPVRSCPARSNLARLRLVRLRPARSRPVRPNPHDAIAHVCIVRARAMRVGCVRLRPARWGVVFVQGFAYVHLVVALVPPPPSSTSPCSTASSAYAPT